jgi:hypothetical protein
LASKFLESSAENLLFIDADISFTLEQILAMREWVSIEPRHCRGTLPGQAQSCRLCWRIETVTGFAGRYAGTGFMLIARPVLERLIEIYLSRKYFSTHVPDTKGGFAFFEPMIDPETGKSVGGFCVLQALRTAVIDIWLDPDGKLVHTGSHVIMPMSELIEPTTSQCQKSCGG